MSKSKKTDDLIKTISDNEASINESNDGSSDFEMAESTFFSKLGTSASSNELKNKIREKLIESTQTDTDLKLTSLNEKIERLNKKKLKIRSKEAFKNKLNSQENASKANNNKEEENNEEDKNYQESEDDEQVDEKNQSEQKKITKKKKIDDISFQKLSIIKPLLKACEDLGFQKPTEIQKMAIPAISSGKDVLANSVTGSGKTAAFLIPILQKYYKCSLSNYSKTLIIIPTRELAIQCYEMLQELNNYTRVSSCLVIGQTSIVKQEAELRRYPDIIIATPGRMVDLIKNSQNFDLEDLEILILDEADKLLEMGFQAELTEIINNSSQQKQTLLFSATLNADVSRLAKLALKKPIKLEATPDLSTVSTLKQHVFKLKREDPDYREACLILLAKEMYTEKVIIFFKTKKTCHRLAALFGLFGLPACELHGNLSQTQRVTAFQDFKAGKYQYLLATDLAARGLDIKDIKTVINFELPIELKRYIHRVGRTARAGKSGISLTLCSEEEMKKFKKMLKQTKDKCFKKKLNENDIKKYRKQIENMEVDYQNILKEESYEKELRKAEMETKKIENLLEHTEEIYNRPKKVWIQSEKEKKELLKREKQSLGLEEEEDYKVYEPQFKKKRKMF